MFARTPAGTDGDVARGVPRIPQAEACGYGRFCFIAGKKNEAAEIYLNRGEIWRRGRKETHSPFERCSEKE